MIIQFPTFIIILSTISVSNSYRILAIFPYHGRSHFNVLEPTAKALASKGHQVDVLSYFKMKEPFPNYTELELPTEESHASIDFNIMSSQKLMFDWMFEDKKRMCGFLGYPKISALIKNPPKKQPYDAIIVHTIYGYQCFSGLGYLWNIPVILVVTTVPSCHIRQFIGDPMSLAILPGHFEFFRQNLTFWERVGNVVKTYNSIWDHDDFRLRQEPLLKKYLSSDIASYRELEKNVALVLTNSHYTFHGIKPITPALIEIGGINIKNGSSTIDANLKKLLDESENGFIYFSLGTLTVLESLPPGILDKLYNVFRRLSPIKIIMRAPNLDAISKNLSENIHIFTWLPQQRILEHPNIKAFVTHGGGLSSQEAVHYAVPIVCMPIFYEQRVNCDIFSLKTMGVKINIDTAEETDYEDALQKVLLNPEYKESIKKFSLLYWDRPQSPQEAVNYWVEYVIRHGKNVLRSPAADLKWWQFDLIDVYCFIFTCFILSIVFAIMTVRYALRMILNVSAADILKLNKLN